MDAIKEIERKINRCYDKMANICFNAEWEPGGEFSNPEDKRKFDALEKEIDRLSQEKSDRKKADMNETKMLYELLRRKLTDCHRKNHKESRKEKERFDI